MLKKMREGRPRAVRLQPPPRLAKLGILVLWVGGSASACATEVNTGEQPEAIAGSGGSNDGPQPTGGKAGAAGMAGNAGSAGKATGGMAGSGISAFGGTSTSGGSATGGSTSAGSSSGGTATGGSATGGAGGAKGGSSAGGAAGSAGAKNGGAAGMGGSTTGGSATGGSGGGLACLEDWQGGTCDTCSTQTQSDKLACVDILSCYKANSCGPDTCSNNDDKCGVNKVGKGTAGYPIAKDVYDCACK